MICKDLSSFSKASLYASAVDLPALLPLVLAGVTLKDLSDELGISIPNLSYYMKGREPNYDILINIADYFNVTTDWLIGRTDARNPEALSTFDMVEEKIIKSGCPKISGKTRKCYMEIQSTLLDTLENVYLIYGALGDNYVLFLHKQFPMLFQSFSRGIREYLYVLGSNHKFTSKDKILEFIKNVDLIAEITHQITLGSSYLLVMTLFVYLDDIPKDELYALKQIMDFTIDRFEDKFPDEKIQEMVIKMNNLHSDK